MPGTYYAEYSLDSYVGWTALTNVQEITMSIGRQRQLDAYNASTATITMRYPTGYASPITALTAGTFIRIGTPNAHDAGGTYWGFFGNISDVTVQYGIPYVGSVGNADYVTINVEGNFARAARMSGQNYALSAGALSAQCVTAAAQSGINITTTTGQSDPQMGATTISGTWGDWCNLAMNTINGRLWDVAFSGTIYLKSPYIYQNCTVGFSDTTNNATNQVYDQINFSSWADNYYTQVTVTPAGFAAQTATKSGATTPYRTLSVNSLSASTGQATDQANFLLNQYGNSGYKLSSISCFANAQNSFKLDTMGLTQLGVMIGANVAVVFRGTTYQCVIEGINITATPEDARYTYFLSAADYNNYLILNDSVYGKLNNNRLGY